MPQSARLSAGGGSNGYLGNAQMNRDFFYSGASLSCCSNGILPNSSKSPKNNWMKSKNNRQTYFENLQKNLKEIKKIIRQI